MIVNKQKQETLDNIENEEFDQDCIYHGDRMSEGCTNPESPFYKKGALCWSCNEGHYHDEN